MFSRACTVCFADTLLSYEHMAWHILQGHDISQERQETVKKLAKALVDEAQRQYEAARAQHEANKQGG